MKRLEQKEAKEAKGDMFLPLLTLLPSVQYPLGGNL